MTKTRDLADLGGGFIQAGTGAAQRTVESKLQDVVSVKDFGAVGNGTADDTAAIQAAITASSVSGAVVLVPSGTYSVSTLTVTNGTGGIYCEGTIKGQGSAPVATLVLGSDGNGVEDASFTLKLDQSSGDLIAVQGYDTTRCSFVDCLIYGFVNSATLNHFAFRMNGPCTGNIFQGNRITLYDTPTQRGFGIALYGTPGTALDYGGFFAGTLSPSRAQFPATQNVITGNHVEDGSYAVSIQYSEYNSVVGNVFRNQKRRTIYLAAAAFANTISGNVCIDYVSSGVLLGYNSYDNVVNGNRFETTDISGEAAVNINTGSSNNLISGNSIVSATNYGVYLGCDVSNNVVSSNNISNYYLAGVCVENDFVTPRPANALYSRPNYGPPPSPYTEWSQKNSTGNVIQGNTFGAGYSGRGTASIAVAQLDGNNTTETSGTIISDNVVNSGDNITYNMHMYANTSTRLTDTTITGNNFNSANTFLNRDSSGDTSWYPRIDYYKNNKELDIILDAEEITFADGDTTPSISINAGPSNNRVYAFFNSSPTTVTDFDNGINGQVITLRLNPNTTIAYASGLIRPKGLVDVVGGSTNQFIQFRQSSGVWFETWRNF